MGYHLRARVAEQPTAERAGNAPVRICAHMPSRCKRQASNGDVGRRPLTSDFWRADEARGRLFEIPTAWDHDGQTSATRQFSLTEARRSRRGDDPHVGRWLSNDPIGISGGLNQYTAFGNNPVMFVDPWGEAPMGDGERYLQKYRNDAFRRIGRPLRAIFDDGNDLRFSDTRDWQWRGGIVRFDSMGNIGAGYAFSGVYGAGLTGLAAVAGEFLQPPWEGWDAALGSWYDNMKGIWAAVCDDPWGTGYIPLLLGPISGPVVN